jgi:hypothetical protein
MPTMPEVLAKGPILIELDRVLSDPTGRTDLKAALEDPNEDMVTIALRFGVVNPGEEEDHLRNDWFGTADTGGGWWRGAQPLGRLVRPALIAAIDKSEELGGLPVDCYWVCDPGHGQHPYATGESGPTMTTTQSPADDDNGSAIEAKDVVEVTTSWTDRQVTFIIFTPHPPHRYDPHPDSVVENILITKVENGAVVTEPVMRHP